MSDYVDTVDIEGTQYDIQDTATKEKLEDLQILSNSKKVVGKDIDGRPIYEQVLTGLTPSSGSVVGTRTSVEVPLLSGVEELISAEGYFSVANVKYLIGSSIGQTAGQPPGSYSQSTVILGNNNLGLFIVTNYSNQIITSQKYRLTLHYTLTADTPQP